MLLGDFGQCDATHFGGTQYAKVILKSLWGLPPALDMDHEKRVQQAIREIIGAGLAESAHDISDGGFAVALAECCFGPAEVGPAFPSTWKAAAKSLCFTRILRASSSPPASRKESRK